MSVLRRCSIFQQPVICVASWQKPQSLPKHTRTHYVKTHTQTFKMSTKTAAADILNGRQAWLYMHTLRRTFNHHWSRGAPTQTPLRCMFILYTCNQTKRALINQQAISYTSICMLCVPSLADVRWVLGLDGKTVGQSDVCCWNKWDNVDHLMGWRRANNQSLKLCRNMQ